MKGEKRRHAAPFKCWIKHGLRIISPSRTMATCDYGQKNSAAKCEGCKHNVKKTWEKQWEEMMIKTVRAARKAAARNTEPRKKEE